MNIVDMKKAVANAMVMYENMVKTTITDCIREIMCELQDDSEDYKENTYYVETLTEKQAMQATDEEFNTSELQQNRIRATLKECECELHRLLEPIDEWCEVETHLYCDNTISFEIKADEMEFEIEYKNRYNI